MKHRFFSFLLALSLICTLILPAAATDRGDSVKYYTSIVSDPGYGAEWGVIAACTEGNTAYGNLYWKNIQTTVKDAKGQLDSRKSTETSRVILAITATGNDATTVGGYNLVSALNDMDFVVNQGINGAIFALLALDAGAYVSNMRDSLVQYILDAQLTDGGWALTGEVGDTDMTAMALQALSPYQSRADVQAAVASALARLSSTQKASGGYAAYGVENCESTAQVILALCQLGIDLNDSRFVKSGKTTLEALQSYRLADDSYSHLAGGATSEMATYQAAMALISLALRQAGQPGIYTMSPTFSDLSGHWAAGNVQDAVNKGIFVKADGSLGCFRPDVAMTRSNVIKAIWRMHGAPEVDTSKAETGWKSYPHMVWALQEGIIDSFDPNGSLTRAQLATMLWRMSGEPSATAASKSAYQLSDLAATPAWADTAMGWALKTGLIEGSDGKLAPNDNITRAQAATLLLRYLEEIS